MTTEKPSSSAGEPAPAAAKFVTGDLMRHVTVMSFTGSIGLMAIFLVDLADLYFISLLGQAELAAAVGYAAAILFFTTSVSIGLAIAMGALVARSLGAGDPERARLYATNALVVSLAASVIVAAAVWIYIPELVALIGAKGETAAFAESYLSIVAPSLPLLNCMMAGGAILRAHGDARRAMNTTVTAATVNAALDPIFIFALGLGLEGAALASVAARLAGALVAFRPILQLYGGFAPLRWPELRADFSPIARLAGPALLTNIATPVGAGFVTASVAQFGDAAVAGYAIVGRLTPVAFGVVFALSGAIGPIVGQNAGAGRFDRVRGAITNALVFLAVYVLAVSLLLFATGGFIADAFGATDEARDLVLLFCGPLALAFFFNGVLFAANAAFNNLGRPFLSTQLNWGRHTLGTIPFAMVGGALAGAPGVLIGQAAGGVVFAVVAVVLAYRLVDRQAAAGASEAETPKLTPWRWPSWPFSFPRS